MPRIRTIKPEFFQDEDIAKLPALDRLAFVGMWCYADREGRIEDRPARLQVQILPYEKCDFPAIIDRLIAGGFLLRYEAEGRSYLLIRTFARHQKPHHTERESDLPAPPSDLAITAKQPLPNGECRVGMDLGKERKGKESVDAALLLEAWNKTPGVQKARTMTGSRERHAAARLREGTPGEWAAAYALIAADPWCRGENDRGWKADFDYALSTKAVRWLDRAKAGSASVEPDTEERRQKAAVAFGVDAALLSYEPSTGQYWRSA